MGSASAPVVVGIDGSDAAIHAAIGAIDEAISRDVPMRMVHVTRCEQQAGARDDFRLEVQYAATALRVAAAVVEATGKQVKIETGSHLGHNGNRSNQRIPTRIDNLSGTGGGDRR